MSIIYRSVITSADKFIPSAVRPFWEHSAGPKTIFFWAPMMKWGLVIASISDMTRPADKLSASQTAAIAATGVIYSRYSMVITPKNWSLFSVNVFVAITNLYQLYRVFDFKINSKKNNSIPVSQ